MHPSIWPPSPSRYKQPHHNQKVILGPFLVPCSPTPRGNRCSNFSTIKLWWSFPVWDCYEKNFRQLLFMSFCGFMFSFLLDKYLAGGRHFLTLWLISSLFPKWIYRTPRSNVVSVLVAPNPFQHLMLSVFKFSLSSGFLVLSSHCFNLQLFDH